MGLAKAVTRVAGCGARAPGYTVIGFLLVMFGLTTVGILVATSFLGRMVEKNQVREERTLDRIRATFLESVARTQVIPTHTNWLTALAPYAGLDQTGLSQAHPEWGTDSTLSRAFLVDTNLPSTLLPYRQGVTGLTGSATNLLGSSARVMIVSSTKRGLALPVSSGVPSASVFNAIWNWDYNPSTKAPPSGWSSTWNGFGEFLHVERIHLAGLFHQVTCNNLIYGLGGAATVTNRITNSTTFQFLYGTPLLLAGTNGVIRRAHVVTRDVTIDMSAATNAGPILRYTFSESSGTVATNSSTTTGSSANGVYTNGVTLGSAGPRSPTYSGFSSTNRAITLDGTNDYVKGTNGLMNNLSAFTIAGWIYPTTATLKNLDLFGQEDIAEMGFTAASGKLELWCDAGTKKLHYFYPYGANEWHHVVGVGDGANMYIYVDAVLVASRTFATTTYGSSAKNFNVGGNVFGTGQYFPGRIDEVVVYGRALSATEITQLYNNVVP